MAIGESWICRQILTISYSGWPRLLLAMLPNDLLIVTGALVGGSSGGDPQLHHAKANRSFLSVILVAFAQGAGTTTATAFIVT